MFHLAIELVRQWPFIAPTQCSTFSKLSHRYSSTSQLQQVAAGVSALLPCEASGSFTSATNSRQLSLYSLQSLWPFQCGVLEPTASWQFTVRSVRSWSAQWVSVCILTQTNQQTKQNKAKQNKTTNKQKPKTKTHLQSYTISYTNICMKGRFGNWTGQELKNHFYGQLFPLKIGDLLLQRSCFTIVCGQLRRCKGPWKMIKKKCFRQIADGFRWASLHNPRLQEVPRLNYHLHEIQDHAKKKKNVDIDCYFGIYTYIVKLSGQSSHQLRRLWDSNRVPRFQYLQASITKQCCCQGTMARFVSSHCLCCADILKIMTVWVWFAILDPQKQVDGERQN